MRKFLLIGAGLVTLAMSGAAKAQTPPMAGDNARPGQPPMEGHGPMEMGRRGGGGGHIMEMMNMMQRGQAARFRFRRGDEGIDIRCAGNESTQACVAAAGTLMDKLGAMRPAGQ